LKATFAYTGIRVKNLEESVEFYTKLLGMKEVSRGSIEATDGLVVSLTSEDGGPQLELNFYGKTSKFATDYSVGEGIDHLAFKVDDLDKALHEAARLGHPAKLEMKADKTRWAYIQDPNGIFIELFS
jgi:lactoylglutathione lyase